MPRARRPAQLRHHLFRRGPDRLRRDRQPARPAGRHAGAERPDHARTSSRRRWIGRRTDREQSSARSSCTSALWSARSWRSYIRVQIEEAVYYLFTWTSGTFNFEAGVRPEREDFLVRINPESLLLEGARRVDEWSLIEKKIPSFDLIFAVDATHIGQSAPELSDEQQRLLPLLDGTRDVTAGDRGERPGRVRGRQGALRPDHRRVRPPGGHLGRRPRRRSTTAGWMSTAISGSPSTRRRCSTRRCGSSAASPISGPPIERAVLPRPDRAAAGAVGGGGRAPSARRSRRAASARPRCTTSRSRWSGWAGWTRPRPRTAMRPGARATTRG